MPGTHLHVLAVAAVATLAGCGSGGDGTIPPDKSDQLTDLLAATEERVAAGDCDLAFRNAGEVATQADALPPEVDPEVQQALVEAAANLVGLVDDQCEQTTGPSGFEEEQPTTEPEATEPETTETTTTKEMKPPEEERPEQPNGQGGNDEPPAPPPEEPPDQQPPDDGGGDTDDGPGGGGTGGTGGTVTPGGGGGGQ